MSNLINMLHRNIKKEKTLFSKIRIAIRNYLAYKEAFRELNSYSDRDLADIGIRRVDIPFIISAHMKD
jgi:uncharacterized protein YjiS (DUF1127 family)